MATRLLLCGMNYGSEIGPCLPRNGGRGIAPVPILFFCLVRPDVSVDGMSAISGVAI